MMVQSRKIAKVGDIIQITQKSCDSLKTAIPAMVTKIVTREEYLDYWKAQGKTGITLHPYFYEVSTD